MSNRRERKKANRAAKLAAEAAAEQRARRIRTIRNVVIFALFILALLFLLGCGSDSEAGSSPTTTVSQQADGDDAGPETVDGDEGDTAAPIDYGTTPCPPTEGTDEPVLDFDDSFERCIEEGATYTAVIETTHGTVTVELDSTDHPVTTNNFVALARSGYYDDTDLFRTEAQTGIIQGGSPHTQDNTDPGPGYTIGDEGPAATADDYGPGTLAMARTAAPNSASAQFFFLATEGGRYLGDPRQLGADAGSYRVFGRTVDGLDVLEDIAALDDGTGRPTEPAAILSIEIDGP